MNARLVIQTIAYLILTLPAMAASSTKSSNAVTLPFTIQRGHVVVATMLNGTRVSAMVDTGYEMTMVHPDIAEKLALERTGRMTIVGIAGEEPADVFTGAAYTFGDLSYTPRRVAALRSDKGRRGWDAILGAGLFRRFVVEFRPAQRQMVLHEPPDYSYSANGTVVPLQFRRRSATPLVDAELESVEGNLVRGRFELDTGCDGGLCLGRDFVDANGLLRKSDRVRPSGRRGVGGGTGSLEGRLPELRMGAARVVKPETHFFTEGSPVDEGLAGHIGWAALSTFQTVILDYRNRRMILEPAAAKAPAE